MIGDLKFEVWDKKWEKLPLLGTAHIAMATAITSNITGRFIIN